MKALAGEDLTHQWRAERPLFPWGPLLALVGIFVLLTAVSAEIALRLPDLRCAGGMLEGQKGLFELDPAAGYAMRPNLCVRLRSAEFDQILRTNRHGLVGPDVSAVKEAGEFRILVLGDSYTAAGQVPYEESYTALLERRLHEDGFGQVRVINAAVGGWSTINQAGFLDAHLSWLQPDLVVVAAFLGNDVGENVLATRGGYREAPEHPKGITFGRAASDLLQASIDWFPHNGRRPRENPHTWDPGQPLPTPVPNPTPELAPILHPAIPPIEPVETVAEYGERLQTLAEVEAIPSGPSGEYLAEAIRYAERERAEAHSGARTQESAVSAWDATRAHSRLLGWMFGEPDRDAGAVTTAPGAAPPSDGQKLLNISSFAWLLLRQTPRAYWLDVAWPLFGKYLDKIHQTAASAGAPTVLMAIPHLGQFDDEMRARVMADYRFAEDEVDWERPQRDLRRQAEGARLPLLDLLPVFRARADRDRLYLRQDTHFNALGHQVTAEQLATFLVAGGWLH